MFPKTYHDDNLEDRAYADDLWTWLQDQPQDAWLLWARHANWDWADRILMSMVEHPSCDLALASWIFWNAEPGYIIRNPQALYSGNEIVLRIVHNVERNFYKRNELYYLRYEAVFGVHGYIKALRETAPTEPQFKLPRALCGPFNGRHATIPKRYDDETELELDDVMIDGWLPRSEAEHREAQIRGGNTWIEKYLSLPTEPADPIAAYRHLDDAAYAEAIFGTSEDFDRAKFRQANGGHEPPGPGRKWWWPFG